MSQVSRQQEIERLQLLFVRVRSKPEFPLALQRLIELIDHGEPSARDLERIISGQPSLAASLLRVANVSRGSLDPTTTIRGAVIRLGYRSVRSLALSLMVQTAFANVDSPNLNAGRYVRHSLMVAYLAKYLHARTQRGQATELAWSGDEVFAAGLLHDLSLLLLDSVAPDIFARICFYAPKRELTLEGAFAELYRTDVRELMAHAMEVWGMPDLFTHATRNFNNPWTVQQESTSLCCLHYADHLCKASGHAIESWPVKCELDFLVQAEMAIPEAEQKLVIEFVENQVEEHMGDTARIAA